MVLRSALVLTESQGSVAMLSPGRQPERFVLPLRLKQPARQANQIGAVPHIHPLRRAEGGAKGSPA